MCHCQAVWVFLQMLVPIQKLPTVRTSLLHLVYGRISQKFWRVLDLLKDLARLYLWSKCSPLPGSTSFALTVMGKYKVHAYLRTSWNTFFCYSLIGLYKKDFLQPGNVYQENQVPQEGQQHLPVLVSSVNLLTHSATPASRSLIKIVNRTGPRIEP